MTEITRMVRPSRWRTPSLIGLVAALTAGALAVALAMVSLSPQARAAGGTLAQLAEAHGKYFGSATTVSELSDAPYTQILTDQFDLTTPGNAMKWDTTEPSNGQFNFGPGDQLVDFAQAHDLKVRGHNLVWHSQLPSWVSNLPTDQVKAAMEKHIITEVNHYSGQVYSWDVVNEPFDDSGNLRQDAFYQAMGAGYIADALRTAHAADPSAKLYLNDYNIGGSGAKFDAMYNLVKSLKQQGVPIDGVGIEGHLATQYGFPSNLQANMQKYADLGVDVALTEMDVRMPLPSDAAKVATQQQYYVNMVKACLAVTRCVGMEVWDYTDKYSWVPGAFSGQGDADLYDANLSPKPVYSAVARALGGGTTPPTSPPPTTQPPGNATCSVSYVKNQWPGGLTANLTVKNAGSSAIDGWTVTFTFGGDQHVTNAWNATVGQSGATVTARNVSYNGTIPAGGSTTFGFQGTWTSSDADPTTFTLNGTPCT